MSESVPTSVTSFAHRRSRADSTASFTYFQEDEQDRAISDQSVFDDEVDDAQYDEESVDLEACDRSPVRRQSSGYSGASVHDRLLRSDSARTDASNPGRSGRTSQKIYIVTEDLTIVIAGFRTSLIGFALYITICVLTLGLAYLLLRWLPRWQVRITGSPCTLRESTWVVVEVSILEVKLITFY